LLSLSQLRRGSLDDVQQFGRGVLSVALRVVGDPSPQILACLLNAELRLPAKLLVGEIGLGGEVQDIALSAADNLAVKLGCLTLSFAGIALNDLSESSHHLLNTGASSRAQVPGLDTGLVLAEVLEGSKVTTGEIEDVDVVTDGCSVMANGVAVLIFTVRIIVV
jgi:hypothetical protein